MVRCSASSRWSDSGAICACPPVCWSQSIHHGGKAADVIPPCESGLRFSARSIKRKTGRLKSVLPKAKGPPQHSRGGPFGLSICSGWLEEDLQTQLHCAGSSRTEHRIRAEHVRRCGTEAETCPSGSAWIGVGIVAAGASKYDTNGVIYESRRPSLLGKRTFLTKFSDVINLSYSASTR